MSPNKQSNRINNDSHIWPCSTGSSNFGRLAVQTGFLPVRSKQNDDQIKERMSLKAILNNSPHYEQHHTGSLNRSPPTRIRPSRQKSSAKDKPRKSPRKRGACAAYSKEQQILIWYFRKDLGRDWDEVNMAYRRHFRDHIRSKGGLQCRFYRTIGDWGVEKVRRQFQHSHGSKRSSSATQIEARYQYSAAYGVTDRTDLVYNWMLPKHQARPVRTGSAARFEAPPDGTKGPLRAKL